MCGNGCTLPDINRQPDRVMQLLLRHLAYHRQRAWQERGQLALLRKVRPFSMAGYRKLVNVHTLAAAAIRNGIDGDFAECGVWRGGCAGIMAALAAREGRGRKTWLFDSFAGLPEPTAADGASARNFAGGRGGGALIPVNQCVAARAAAEHLLFTLLHCDPGHIAIRAGWFQDTLPALGPEPARLALLRLDGDWYESTKICFDRLYDRVSSGGAVIIDDYGCWEGCRRAVDEFIAARALPVTLQVIDRSGRYFVKP